MSYLIFLYKGGSDSGKTKRWTVNNRQTDEVLGWIEWKAAWRKYWFCPVNATGFDADCMEEITNFLRAETLGQKS
jgi:hypothetical protein